MTPGDRDASVWDSLDPLYMPRFPDSCINEVMCSYSFYFIILELEDKDLEICVGL